MVFNNTKLIHFLLFFILLMTINYLCYCKNKYFVQVSDSISENYNSSNNIPDPAENLFYTEIHEIKTKINI